MKYAVRIYNYPNAGDKAWAYNVLDRKASTDINKVFKDRELCDSSKSKVSYEYVVEEYSE